MKVAHFLSVSWNVNSELYYPVKIFFRSEGEHKTFSYEEKQKTVCHQQSRLKGMAEGSSLNRKKIVIKK